MNSQTPQGVLPFDKLIKPGQVQNLACLSQDQKATYLEGITGLWKKVQENPADHPDRLTAHRRLTEVSNRLRMMMQKYRQENPQGPVPNGARPVGQAQQSQPAMSNVEQAPSSSQRPPGGEQYSETVKTQVRNLIVSLPPSLWSLPQEEKQAWIQNEKRTYAAYAQKFETSTKTLTDFKNAVSNRQTTGRPFTAEEKQSIGVRLHAFQQPINEAKEWLMTFKRTQEQYREQQRMAQAEMQARAEGATGQPTNSNQQESGDQPPQAGLVSEEARNQTSQPERPSDSVGQSSAQMSAPQTQATSMVVTPVTQAGQQPPNISSSNSAAQNSPQVPQHPAQNSQGTAGPARPLSHQAAIDKARSYSQASTAQPTPQSSAHGHPNINRDNQQNSRWQPNKPINVTPLAPVTMGPARPTLSGGPSAGGMGPMGQPGIAKHPGYVLEGEGERVLSKKKLEELVRQVTGASEGDGETLDPEVEETLLDVADEFVDNVIIAACRLAKLRGSATLDIRDLQIILERNYNIRVPGFSSDELRTVKKIQPTQAWSQKISAVQAAKVTGGKGDI